jgi:hypothetical protein
MSLTTDQKSSLLFKQAQGVAETSMSRDFFEEPKLGRPLVFSSQIWSESASIPQTAPVLSDLQESGVIRRYVEKTMTAVAGTSNSFFLEELKDSIPFNFGDGSYNYQIKSSTGSTINFGQGDWIVNNAAGTLTFYGSVPANMPPKISFYRYIGEKGAASSGELGNYIPSSEKGSAGGVASLNEESVIPKSQISLVTDDVPEGLNPTNLWFTAERAKEAVITDTIDESTSDMAPSASAVASGLAAKGDKSDGWIQAINDNASAIPAGKLVYIKENGHMDLADCSSLATCGSVVGFTNEPVASLAIGNVTVRPGEYVDTLTGLNVGKTYYASIDGTLTLNPDTDVGKVLKVVGFSVSSSKLFLKQGESLEIKSIS